MSLVRKQESHHPCTHCCVQVHSPSPLHPRGTRLRPASRPPSSLAPGGPSPASPPPMPLPCADVPGSAWMAPLPTVTLWGCPRFLALYPVAHLLHPDLPVCPPGSAETTSYAARPSALPILPVWFPQLQTGQVILPGTQPQTRCVRGACLSPHLIYQRVHWLCRLGVSRTCQWLKPRPLTWGCGSLPPVSLPPQSHRLSSTQQQRIF